MDFYEVFKKAASTKLTENGALAYNNIGDPLVELFSQIGSLRSRKKEEIENKFSSAFNKDRELAVKLLFYSGDVRGGLGERRTFRICLKWLANNYPTIVRNNLMNIPYYNRWDSLFELVGTPVEDDMWDFINFVLLKDIAAMKENEECTLLAKWLPSENTSSRKTRELARVARKKLRLGSKRYRQILTALRAYLDIVEVHMSAKEWSKIEYSKVPSLAMLRYRKAFERADSGRFSAYMESVAENRNKINASVLFPYDLAHAYLDDWGEVKEENAVIEAQWKALPNYITGENNIIVMADMSGSMYGRPMETASSLAIYFAERNKGVFEGLFMTFSSRPNLFYVGSSESFNTKLRKIFDSEVGYSTNLQAAFYKILELAVTAGIPSDEMPKALVVISDMEIDRYIEKEGLDFVEQMRRTFAERGYKLPKLILWNAEARNDTFLTQDDQVIYVGGQSPSVFELLMGSLNGKTSRDIMLEALSSERYDKVII